MALVDDVYCIFVTLPCGILGQVWYLSVSFPLFVVFLTCLELDYEAIYRVVKSYVDTLDARKAVDFNLLRSL